MLWAGLAPAASLDSSERHYDARAGLSSALTLDQLRAQAKVPEGLASDVQELSALEVDEITGAVRSLVQRTRLSECRRAGQAHDGRDGFRAQECRGPRPGGVRPRRLHGVGCRVFEDHGRHSHLSAAALPGHSGLQRATAGQREPRRPHHQREQLVHGGAAARGTCAEAGQAIAGGGDRSPEVLRHESDAHPASPVPTGWRTPASRSSPSPAR